MDSQFRRCDQHDHARENLVYAYGCSLGEVSARFRESKATVEGANIT